MTPLKCARLREWVSRWGRDVHVASGCQGEKSRVEMPLVARDWVYRVLFSGQVGAWSTTPLPCPLSNVPAVAIGYLDGVEMCTWQVGAKARKVASRCLLWRVIGSIVCCFRVRLVLGPPHYHDTFQMCQTSRVGISMGSRCARGKWVPRREKSRRDASCGV